MMDFGFGAFLEKFEDHFGRAATRGLLAMIGLAVTCATGALIANTVVIPLWKYFGVSSLLNTSSIQRIVITAIPVGAGWGLGFFIARWLEMRFFTGRLNRIYEKTIRRTAEVEALTQQGDELLQRSREIYAANLMAFRDIVAKAVEKGVFSQDLADEFLSLVDTEEKTPP